MNKLILSLLLVVSASAEFPSEQKCPEDCDCHYYRVNYVTDCSESNLTKIPYDEISPNVYILDMNGNELTDIQPFPEDVKIRRLQLSDNKISELTADMFAGLKYIVDIDLSGNNISKVDPNSFRDSHGLITIELQNNPLMNVEAGPFLKCRSLLHLDLSNCGLSKLNGDFFTEIPLLTHLDLSGNPLQAIKASAFRPLATLSELILRECQLTNLEPDFLEYQHQLKLLDLSGNELTSVNWVPIFGGLPRLENLNLHKTKLENLPDDVFVNNTFLRILILSDNQLTDFDIKTTLGQNLKNLNSLDLSNCRLSGPLDEKSFMNATTLKILNLSSNRLSSRDLSVALSPLTKLTTLSLKDCSLSKLPRNTFENLSQLKELDISWNPLNNVFDDLLDSLKNLEYLNMGYSNLSKLSKDTFSKTRNLKRLILSGNALGELEAGLFNNLTEIETLEIENCGLKKAIDERVFFNRTYGNLRELKMAGNPLEILEGGLFPEQMSHLKMLDLSNCNISYLPDECFNNTMNLTHLYLTNNKFSSEFLSNSTFLNVLINLEYLDLSGNLLTTLEPKIIEHTQLKRIKLTNNPWICDCTLADWWNWAIDGGDISRLIGSTLTLDDATGKLIKQKKGLICRIDSKITPPLRNSTNPNRKQRVRPSVRNKTWARYLKESDCEVRTVKAEDVEMLPTPQPKTGTTQALDEPDSFDIAAVGFVLVVSFALGCTIYGAWRRESFAYPSR